MTGKTFPEEDLPLEGMDPSGLLDYINRRQSENLGEPPVSGDMKSDLAHLTYFQDKYGPERTARMLRYVFETESGIMKVSKRSGAEIEEIDANHFRPALEWWHIELDKACRREIKRTENKIDFEREYTFATSLRP